jgi:hypothetical protein
VISGWKSARVRIGAGETFRWTLALAAGLPEKKKRKRGFAAGRI